MRIRAKVILEVIAEGDDFEAAQVAVSRMCDDLPIGSERCARVLAKQEREVFGTAFAKKRGLAWVDRSCWHGEYEEVDDDDDDV